MSIHQAKGLEFPVVIVPDLAASVGSARFPVALWHARFGCVARPPADEPLPFSNLGWRLREASETVAEEREDLRTLYVACTRAMDYLLLSAALPDNFSPQTPWLLALASRFELSTGRCQVPGLADADIPGVRVTDAACEPADIKLAAADGEPVQNGRPVPEMPSVSAASFSLRPSARHWDAEDGSDRHDW